MVDPSQSHTYELACEQLGRELMNLRRLADDLKMQIKLRTAELDSVYRIIQGISDGLVNQKHDGSQGIRMA